MLVYHYTFVIFQIGLSSIWLLIDSRFVNFYFKWKGWKKKTKYRVMICVSLKLWLSFHFVTWCKKYSNRMRTYILEILPKFLFCLMWHVYPWGFSGKESACNAGYVGSVPGWGRCPGGGHSNPLQYSYLENPMNRGAWWATVHSVAKSRTRLNQLSMHACISLKHCL